MSTRRIGLTAIGAALLLTLVWYVALFRPQSDHMKAATQAYSAAQQQVQSLQTKVAALEVLQKEIPADKAALQKLDAAMPTSPDLRDVLNQLHSIATADGVNLTTFSPGQAKSSSSGGATGASSAGPQSLSLSMSVIGPYQNLMSFISSLNSMPRTVVVDSMTVSVGAGGKLTANLAARAFYQH